MKMNLRTLLYPFSLVYGFGVRFRNRMYDKKVFRSVSFDLPVICIGNLSVGGTGKTPMAEYLIRILETKFKVAVLSRGYKRKTNGFLIADENVGVSEIGDEPMQIHRKFPGVAVAVARERVIGIPQLLYSVPDLNVIILDDAFQHRMVRAGLNILLTAFDNLFTRDQLLPAGNLRDSKSSKNRADIVVVTKCDPQLSQQQASEIQSELALHPNQEIYFATLNYDDPVHLFNKSAIRLSDNLNVLIVCGIADPSPLLKELRNYTHLSDLIQFRDHHNFRDRDIKKIKERFEKMGGTNKILLTTEKDAVRLEKFKDDLKGMPVYVWPVRHEFLFSSNSSFEDKILKYVSTYQSGSGKIE